MDCCPFSANNTASLSLDKKRAWTKKAEACPELAHALAISCDLTAR